MIKLISKVLIIVPLIMLFNLLEYGFKWQRTEHFLYPIILASTTIIGLYIPKSRKFLLMLSLCLLLMMILLYLLNRLNAANIVGSFGFSVFFITIVCYLPQLVSKGFLEKF